MLDEAIEYLKTLQMQVQMMWMGSGMAPPAVMFPGMQMHQYLPQMGPPSMARMPFMAPPQQGHGVSLPEQYAHFLSINHHHHLQPPPHHHHHQVPSVPATAKTISFPTLPPSFFLPIIRWMFLPAGFCAGGGLLPARGEGPAAESGAPPRAQWQHRRRHAYRYRQHHAGKRDTPKQKMR